MPKNEDLWFGLGYCPIEQKVYVTGFAWSEKRSAKVTKQRAKKNGFAYYRHFLLQGPQVHREVMTWLHEVGIPKSEVKELTKALFTQILELCEDAQNGMG